MEDGTQINIERLDEARIAVIGLGYVGLPLAAAFGAAFDTIGFDINRRRVEELESGHDRTREVTAEELAAARRLRVTADVEQLRDRDVYVVSVPTPIDDNKQPDLGPLTSATATVGETMSPGAVVVFESTVYPGATEEVCVPILETRSGLKLNEDFAVGYSPERINPGDREHRLASIVKVVSGSTPETASFVEALYGRIVGASTHRTSSIKVAEAAKVIENTQRDLNIALVNELAVIFHRLGIDTLEVLEAAGTKWNFLPFRPGLVGGHCIGVDPYYLTHKALQLGYHPEVILAGRKLNDGMGSYVAERIVKLMTRRRMHVVNSRILVMGLTFKENCPDLRNSRVIDIVRELQNYHAEVHVHDPWADPDEAASEFGLELTGEPPEGAFDAIIVAVAHECFREMGPDAVRRFGATDHILFDVKSLFPKDAVDDRL